jgi:hypothetical protein
MTEWLKRRHPALLVLWVLAVFLSSAAGFVWFSDRVNAAFAEQLADAAFGVACGYIAIRCAAVLIDLARILWLTAREVRHDRRTKGSRQ